VTRSLLAGVDAGTTSVKALLLSPEGEEVAIGHAPTVWTSTEHGHETTARHLLEAARAALADALRQSPDDRVVAVGVASMAESAILTDARDTPIGPVIAWHDHRDESELENLRAEIGGPRFSRRTGLPLWAQWTLTKHRWLRDHVPAVASARRHYSVAEWIVRGLGGERASELSLASRTGWLDLHTRTLWADTLDWSGASASLLADLVPAGTPTGTARAGGSLAALDGAVLTVAGHDHQAAAVGLGCHRPGDEFDSCGTAEAILRTATPGLGEDVVEHLTGQGITVGWHAARDRWCLLGATQGGLILGKVMTALGVAREGLADLDRAARDAADRPAAVTLGPGAGDVAIDSSATAGEVWRAATRAVSAQAAGLSDVLSGASGFRTGLVVAGGWTNSSALMLAKSEAVGTPRRATTAEAGCRGAALIAGLAAGLYSEFTDMPTAATAV
jgi:sugar (pentulose or hexulose) kinase